MFPFSFYRDAVEMLYDTPRYETTVFQLFVTTLRNYLRKRTVNNYIILICDDVD